MQDKEYENPENINFDLENYSNEEVIDVEAATSLEEPVGEENVHSSNLIQLLVNGKRFTFIEEQKEKFLTCNQIIKTHDSN